MKFITIFALGLLGACVKSPETVVEGGRSTASVNPEAPYIWNNKVFPKTLYLSSNFSTDEVTNIKDMATAWKTSVNNRKTWFNVSASAVSNKANNVNPDLLLDSTLGIYKTTQWPSDIPGEALAVTQIFGRRYNAGQENEYVGIEHADILVNYEDHVFDTNDNPADFDADYDLQTVILHELGHFLGLGHIPREEDRTTSVMYPSITAREVKKVPRSRDITTLVDRYGVNLGTTVNAIASNNAQVLQARDGDSGVETRVVMELRKSGECVHKVDGVEVRRHQVQLKK